METVFRRIAGSHAAVHIYRAGQPAAPTILALHGFTGSAADFTPLRALPGEDAFHWVCPDFMGHGQSASPTTLDAYCLPAGLQLIDEARRLAPDPERVILLAYSMGGRLALHYLSRAKPLPAFLIGASPGLDKADERAERKAMDARWINRLTASGDSAMEDFCAAWEAQPLIESQTRLPEPLRSQLAKRRRENNPVGLAHSLMACGTAALPSLWRRLPDCPPLTLLHGEWDSKFAGIARAMCKVNPSFHRVEIPASGHAPHLEQPEAVRDVLANRFPR